MTWHTLSPLEAAQRLGVNPAVGLSSDEAVKRQQEHGKNLLEQKKRKSLGRRLLEQLNDYMVIILLIAAAVSFATSLMQGERDFFDPIVILLIVVMNAVIGVFQESKAEHALEALQKMSSPVARVLRDGKLETIDSEELTVGDIIYLKTGDFIPADARIIEEAALTTDEAALTGESISVEKTAKRIAKEETDIGDCHNMLWATTVVTSGHATAVVVATGMNTQVGRIARMIITSEIPPTPLQQKLAKTGKYLGTVALLICALIFLMGLLKHMPPFDMFMTSVSLAVAAIPEGLPAIVTIMLALGVQRMAKKNAIIRKLPAVETLGGATVICSDKTGTLTQNRMTVTEIYGNERLAYTLGVLCNNGGNPTESALLDAAERDGVDPGAVEQGYPRMSEIPFDSGRKLMTTVHKIPHGYRIITKGAPDILLERCSMTRQDRQAAMTQNDEMAAKALRVLAIAYRDVQSLPKELEQGLHFVGLFGMMDPPRPEVAAAVRTCKKAGIKAVMITGDHVRTAVAVARSIGMFAPGDDAITGAELSKLSDDELARCIGDYTVFARVTPEHKVRIVKAFQRRGEVVAMTGDGVNDAPALQSADIGCAMGIGGTDVAKGAADMVLTDDNFATIVEAVREGRGIYANIRKAVHFLLSSNIGEILTIFVAIFFGWQAPLVAIQLLWVNLVTDSLPAIALGVDGIDPDIMSNKPVSPKKSLFADGLGLNIFIEGVMIGMLSLLTFGIATVRYADLTVARTMAFAVLGLSQLVHAFNMRSDKSLFHIGVFTNKYLVYAFLICTAMQVGVISVPALAAIFKAVPLGLEQWGIVALFSVMPLLIIELEKLVARSSRKKEEFHFHAGKKQWQR